MKIAILSDTHDRVRPGLVERIAAGAPDEIWHLGDVCEPSTLVELELIGVPLRVVRGNCDWEARWPLALTLEREGVLFYLTHIPPTAQALPPAAQVVLHGHLHCPRDEVLAGRRWLSPGSASQPRGGSRAGFAWMEAAGGRLTRWEQVWL